MTELLNDREVTDGLAALPGWSRDGDEIRAQFKAADFVAAVAFVDEVALRAEAAGHHPDIDIRWNRVSLALSTHSAGGLTSNDLAMATEISTVAADAALEIG